LGSSSFITDATGISTQHLQYLPYGELFVEQRGNANYFTPYMFSAKEKDEETGYSYFGARYLASDFSIWLSVDPLSDKYPNISPFAYCAWNPIMLVDPDGRDWYKGEGENGTVTWTDCTNKKEFYKSGTKGSYLGKTHTDSKGNYYSLFGNTLKTNSKQGKITQKVDDAFIKYAKYLEASKSVGWSSESPYAEPPDPYQERTDFSGIIPFKDSHYTTSENIHDPSEMGKYAGVADITLFVTGSRMDGKLDCFSSGMKKNSVKDRSGNYGISGYLLNITNIEGYKDNYIVTLRFGNKSSVDFLINRFNKIFPNSK
jgi:RHS repeat-associated protein